MRHTFEVIIKAVSGPQVRPRPAARRGAAAARRGVRRIAFNTDSDRCTELISPQSSPHCIAAPDN